MEVFELVIVCDAEYLKASKVADMKMPTERWIEARLPDSFHVLLELLLLYPFLQAVYN